MHKNYVMKTRFYPIAFNKRLTLVMLLLSSVGFHRPFDNDACLLLFRIHALKRGQAKREIASLAPYLLAHVRLDHVTNDRAQTFRITDSGQLRHALDGQLESEGID